MILVDSSVWIDFFNGTSNLESDYLNEGLGTEEFVLGDLILAEVLQGFRSDSHFQRALDALREFPIFSLVGADVAIDAAINFRTLRKRGITVRKTTDVIIGTFCISRGIALLHRDRDFVPFVQHLGLAVPRLST